MLLNWLRHSQDLTEIQQNFFTETLTRYLIEYFEFTKGVVIDVGGNQGFHVRSFKKNLGPFGHIHVFEPNEIYSQDLLGILDEKDFLHPVVAADFEGKIDFYISEDGNLSTTLPPKSLDSFEVLQVTAKMGDSCICNGDIVVGMKVDVEGAEYQVLKGFEKAIKKDFPIIILEKNSSSAAEDYLSSLGYQFYNLFGDLLYENQIIFCNYIAMPPGRSIDNSWTDSIDMNEYFDWYTQNFKHH